MIVRQARQAHQQGAYKVLVVSGDTRIHVEVSEKAPRPACDLLLCCCAARVRWAAGRSSAAGALCHVRAQLMDQEHVVMLDAPT